MTSYLFSFLWLKQYFWFSLSFLSATLLYGLFPISCVSNGSCQMPAIKKISNNPNLVTTKRIMFLLATKSYNIKYTSYYHLSLTETNFPPITHLKLLSPSLQKQIQWPFLSPYFDLYLATIDHNPTYVKVSLYYIYSFFWSCFICFLVSNLPPTSQIWVCPRLSLVPEM